MEPEDFAEERKSGKQREEMGEREAQKVTFEAAKMGKKREQMRFDFGFGFEAGGSDGEELPVSFSMDVLTGFERDEEAEEGFENFFEWGKKRESGKRVFPDQNQPIWDRDFNSDSVKKSFHHWSLGGNESDV
jgi:hypothetical protein